MRVRPSRVSRIDRSRGDRSPVPRMRTVAAHLRNAPVTRRDVKRQRITVPVHVMRRRRPGIAGLDSPCLRERYRLYRESFGAPVKRSACPYRGRHSR